MSNATRKKIVDFKKLLITDEEKTHTRKKGFKKTNSNQNNSSKKDKNVKPHKLKEIQQNLAEKEQKKLKIKTQQKKEQISLPEFTNKLNEFQSEIAFLNKKRNADINIDKFIHIQKNFQSKNNISKIKKFENSDEKNNINNKNDSNNQLMLKKIIKNDNLETSTLITDFYKLNKNLFESNRLDNSKPNKFIEYLISGKEFLFNLKKDKTKFEELKKGITLKQKNSNTLNDEELLNKNIYEYLKCDFSSSFMKKAVEKVNKFLMNRYIKKEKSSLDTSINNEKKDKFTYSNFLSDKLKDNTNKSILSFTNDNEYFKSLIYVCNKYCKSIGKKEVPERALIESLEKNQKILENFKNFDISTNDKDNPAWTAKKIEDEYLKDLLNSKSIKKYFSKIIKIFSKEALENNVLLKNLDKNNFFKIVNIIIKNKNDDDIDKLYKIIEEENVFNIPKDNLNKNDVKNFIILLRFMTQMIIWIIFRKLKNYMKR